MTYPLTFKHEPLRPDCMYHVYNRANGHEKLFLSTANYHFFLKQYLLFIGPIADTFCYCLMPNHFHLLIRIKPWDELAAFFNGIQKLRALHESRRPAEDEITTEPQEYTPKQMEKLLTKQFSNLFSSYTLAFNKQNMRMGSMFMKNYKRKSVTDEQYRRTLTTYIHMNPVDSCLCNRPENWPHSSYRKIISNDNWMLNATEVIDWFDDVRNFMKMHQDMPVREVA